MLELFGALVPFLLVILIGVVIFYGAGFLWKVDKALNKYLENQKTNDKKLIT